MKTRTPAVIPIEGTKNPKPILRLTPESELCYEALRGKKLQQLSGLSHSIDCVLLSSKSRKRLQKFSLKDISPVLKSVAVHKDILDLKLTQIDQLDIFLKRKPECVNKSQRQGSWLEAAVSYVGTAGHSVQVPTYHYASNCSLKAAIHIRGIDANGVTQEKILENTPVVFIKTEFNRREEQKRIYKILSILKDTEISEEVLEQAFKVKILNL